jgi:hypothetical protein
MGYIPPVPATEPALKVRVHVKLASGEEVIVPLWKDASTGEVHVPSALMFQAVWVHELEGRKVLKNKTNRRLFVPIGVTEVGREWLIERGFIRARKPQVISLRLTFAGLLT